MDVSLSNPTFSSHLDNVKTSSKLKQHTTDGKESLKLRIATNHVDGTTRIVSNHNSAASNNHISKDKDRGVVASSKNGGDKKDHKSSSSMTKHSHGHSKDSKNHAKSSDSTSKCSSAAKKGDTSNSTEKLSATPLKSKHNSSTNHSINKSSTPKPVNHVKSSSSDSLVTPKPLKSKDVSDKSKEYTSSKESLNKHNDGASLKPKQSSSVKHNSSSEKLNNASGKSKELSSQKLSDKKNSSSNHSMTKSGDKAGGDFKIKKDEGTKSKESHKDKENHGKKDSSKDIVKESSKEKFKQKEVTKEVLNSSKSAKKLKPDKNKSVEVKIKEETFSDDDRPLSLNRKTTNNEVRKDVKKESTKRKADDLSDDDDEKPLSIRLEKEKKIKKDSSSVKKRKADSDSEDEPLTKKAKKEADNKKTKTDSKTLSPSKRKKETEEQNVWKWWEEEKYADGVKWKTLEHKGPVFAPDYEPLPESIHFYYDGKKMKLTAEAEEVATFYSKLLEHEYTTKEAFNKNFFKDWRKVMSAKEREVITDLTKCDFRKLHAYFTAKSEERKNMTKEEKQVIKKQNEEIQNEYGFCIIDGHKEKIGNFKIEPPGLFRGRGEHPKMGKLKRRTMPEDVTINCGKSSKAPTPPKGHRWKEVRHDNTVTWLACWQENVQGQTKYVMLNPSSKLKGEKDWQKYEVARKLKTCVDSIREQYHKDFRAKEMKVRQRAVALYFIDQLALRAGNEKEEGETADTVGCCSLRVEHITLDEEKDGKPFVVSFDFLGKDSIRYVNSVAVEKRVFKNLHIFMENKQPSDDLFDRLNTSVLNKHLNELMDGLTAKVFRTYNASKTLQDQLELLTNPNDSIAAKLLSYNRANRAVAILCNHQRAVPKTFDKSMENLQGKIKAKEDQVKEAEKELKQVKKEVKNSRTEKDRTLLDRKKKAVDRLKDQLMKLELQATDKEENKQIALGTSKLNYLDPRITVAWCKKYEVPIEKVYNKTHRDKFRWAIEMTEADFVF